MVIILDKDLVISNSQGEKIIELKAGMPINTIRFEYVPKEAFDDKMDFQIDRLRTDAYIVYFRGRFIAVPKNMCTVPYTIGWIRNL